MEIPFRSIFTNMALFARAVCNPVRSRWWPIRSYNVERTIDLARRVRCPCSSSAAPELGISAYNLNEDLFHQDVLRWSALPIGSPGRGESRALTPILLLRSTALDGKLLHPVQP